MKFVLFAALLCLGFVQCGRTSKETPCSVTSSDFLPALVGHRVQVDGILSNAPMPQICGVCLWGRHRMAGKHLRVTGTLQCTVILGRGPEAGQVLDSGSDGFLPPTFHAPGVYYRLQDPVYQLIKKPSVAPTPTPSL